MKCTISGCTGTYECRLITQTVRKNGEVIVIDHVPAEVCPICGDTLLSPDAVRRMESLMSSLGEPSRSIPLYEYA